MLWKKIRIGAKCTSGKLASDRPRQAAGQWLRSQCQSYCQGQSTARRFIARWKLPRFKERPAQRQAENHERKRAKHQQNMPPTEDYKRSESCADLNWTVASKERSLVVPPIKLLLPQYDESDRLMALNQKKSTASQAHLMSAPNAPSNPLPSPPPYLLR